MSRKGASVQYFFIYPRFFLFDQVVFVTLVAVALARDTIISVDQDHHKHTQRGQAGTAVTGTYQ